METSAHESPQTIYVRQLGGFSITVDGKEINDNSNQSKKPWSLLEYLVVFQKKDISVNELTRRSGRTTRAPTPAGP